MCPTLTCLALALVGVDLGYQPTSNGKVEFIIQISPATLQALQPGLPIDIDVQREAQELRPSHFRIELGNEPLPHVLPVAVSNAPARAPIVPATAIGPAMSSDGAQAGQPVSVSPPSFGPATPSGDRGSQAPIQDYPAASPGTASSGESAIVPFAPAGPHASFSPSNQWWLGMSLLVIALAASNGYVGWLFWDARQRYINLLRRTFSVGSQPAEA